MVLSGPMKAVKDRWTANAFVSVSTNNVHRSFIALLLESSGWSVLWLISCTCKSCSHDPFSPLRQISCTLCSEICYLNHQTTLVIATSNSKHQWKSCSRHHSFGNRDSEEMLLQAALVTCAPLRRDGYPFCRMRPVPIICISLWDYI